MISYHEHAYVAHVARALGETQRGEREGENRNERTQMVANYVMLGVKARTKELITA